MNDVSAYLLGVAQTRLTSALERAEAEIKSDDEYRYIKAQAMLAVAAQDALAHIKYALESRND